MFGRTFANRYRLLHVAGICRDGVPVTPTVRIKYGRMRYRCWFGRMLWDQLERWFVWGSPKAPQSSPIAQRRLKNFGLRDDLGWHQQSRKERYRSYPASGVVQNEANLKWPGAPVPPDSRLFLRVSNSGPWRHGTCTYFGAPSPKWGKAKCHGKAVTLRVFLSLPANFACILSPGPRLTLENHYFSMLLVLLRYTYLGISLNII